MVLAINNILITLAVAIIIAGKMAAPQKYLSVVEQAFCLFLKRFKK
jgi:hypothetical protein